MQARSIFYKIRETKLGLMQVCDWKKPHICGREPGDGRILQRTCDIIFLCGLLFLPEKKVLLVMRPQGQITETRYFMVLEMTRQVNRETKNRGCSA